jgi:hypothetical protein
MRIFAIILFSFLCSCQTNEFHFSNEEGSQEITVLYKPSLREIYIIDGRPRRIPDTNYVRISIQDQDPIGDEIWGCWEKNGYEWEMCYQGSSIIENKLDTSRFVFHISLPLGSYGVPDPSRFTQDLCFKYDFPYKRYYSFNKE